VRQRAFCPGGTGARPARAARALDDTWRRRLVSGRSLRRLLDDASVQGRNGVRVLRALLDERGHDYVPPASNLERRFASILAEAGTRGKNFLPRDPGLWPPIPRPARVAHVPAA